MANRIDTFFSEADRDTLTAATTAAEQSTAGELVVYVVERCDPYPEVSWKGALIGGAVGAACAALVTRFVGGWGAADDWWVLIGFQLGVLVGWLGTRLDGISRRLIGNEALSSRVHGRAAEAFVDEQVFATRDRTGILVFVALFEHRVLVVPDEGIRQRVEENAWADIATDIAAGIRAGKPAVALREAIARCAALLHDHGVVGDTTNELDDAPRFHHE